MALKIVSATDPLPIENIVLTIYAAPGLGKTSIAQTSDAPLTLDCDRGIYRAFNRRASVTVSKWSDIAFMTPSDLEPYNTIVIDTAGRALDVIWQDVLLNNPKSAKSDGSPSMQGWGAIKSRFSQWQTFLRAQKKDIVLICHMDEQRSGDETQERIDAQGSSKNEIYKSSDAMCRVRLDGNDQRYLDFDPRQGGFGKNPAQLPKIPVPDLKDNPLFLAGLMSQIKTSLNRQTAEQAASVQFDQDWTLELSKCETLDEINAMIGVCKESKLGKRYKVELSERAKALGFLPDKASGMFVMKAGD